MSMLATYNGLQIASPEPQSVAGKAANENFKKLSTTLAGSDPTTSDDSTQGFALGSRWVNTNSGAEFVCTSAVVGAAVWQSIGVTPAAGSSGEIQFNNGGAFAGDPNLTWSSGSAELTVTGNISSSATLFVDYAPFAGPAISLTGNDIYGTSLDFINTYAGQIWTIEAGRSDAFYGAPPGSFVIINSSLNTIPMYIDPSGNVVITGSLTYSTSDPELETFYPIPLERAVQLLRQSTPPSKWGGISLFFNKDRNQFEAIDHKAAKVFKINMTEIEQLDDVSSLVKPNTTKPPGSLAKPTDAKSAGSVSSRRAAKNRPAKDAGMIENASVSTSDRR